MFDVLTLPLAATIVGHLYHLGREYRGRSPALSPYISSRYEGYRKVIVKYSLQYLTLFVILIYIDNKRRQPNMYTTSTPDGLLNNYATEPAIYPALFPSPEQQRRYALQGAFATLLVTATILIAFAVS